MEIVTTFARHEEFDAARAALDRLSLPYETVSPEPAFRRVGVAALVMDREVRGALAQHGGDGAMNSGWVSYRPATMDVPQEDPAEFAEDVHVISQVTEASGVTITWSSGRNLISTSTSCLVRAHNGMLRLSLRLK